MVTLPSKLGDWQLDHVHLWADRELVIRTDGAPIIGPTTKVATIGSCFASELAASMGKAGVRGAMHPGGLFYTSTTIRQELERLAGGWPERATEPSWETDGGWVDPFRDYHTRYPDESALHASRQEADAAAEALFRDAGVVVVTLGLIEAWRSPTTGNHYRQIPHPAVYASLGPEFHRLTVAEMVEDLVRIRHVIRDVLGAEMVVTTSPVPLHATFTTLDVRVANTESKSRIRAAVSEFVERHPDVHYFPSYEMVVTAERQSDYFREDGRHVQRTAVRYIISEFLRLFADAGLRLDDVDTSWLTPISKTAAVPAPYPPFTRPAVPPVSTPRRIARGVRRRVRAVLGPRVPSS